MLSREPRHRQARQQAGGPGCRTTFTTQRIAVSATLLLAAAVLIGPIPAGADDASLAEVGHENLGARGLNAGLALADHCAYVGSRGQGEVAVVDIGQPSRPRLAGALPGRPGTSTRELRAVADQHLLVVMSFAIAPAGVNRFDLYGWDSDCTRLERRGAYDFGARRPHEFFLWRDTAVTLLYTAMFAGGPADLQVIDVTQPEAPRLIGVWDAPHGALHSLALNAEGTRAYLALWRGGFMVAEVADHVRLSAIGNPLPAPPAGNVHSAVPVPGRDLVVLTDERYPPACPYGPARLVDVSDALHPRVSATLAAPENDPRTCANAPAAAYTSHNATVTADLAFVSWYASGLQVFELSDPSQPRRLAQFRPAAITPGAIDPELGGALSMTWSYPVLRDGLIYVTDINQGLYVLRYLGPHAEQLLGPKFAEGNSNLTFATQGSAPASPATESTPSRAEPTVGSPSRKAPAASRQMPLALALTAVALALAAMAIGVLVFWRRSASGKKPAVPPPDP